MTGGPDDGDGLYARDTEPCLVCGGVISVDFDGKIVWHYRRDVVGTGRLMKWCPGSRTCLEVPA